MLSVVPCPAGFAVVDPSGAVLCSSPAAEVLASNLDAIAEARAQLAQLQTSPSAVASWRAARYGAGPSAVLASVHAARRI